MKRTTLQRANEIATELDRLSRLAKMAKDGSIFQKKAASAFPEGMIDHTMEVLAAQVKEEIRKLEAELDAL